MPTTIEARQKPVSESPPEVLNLEEAAAYLRVAEEDVVDLVTKHGLPGRKIRDQWRFHRKGLIDWLLNPSPKERLLRHAGAMTDDPDLEKMLERIYQDRGRPMTEDNE
jgi:excisionase family DNA binding protein